MQQDTYSSCLRCFRESARVRVSVAHHCIPYSYNFNHYPCVYLSVSCLFDVRSLCMCVHSIRSSQIPGWPFLAHLGVGHKCSPLLVPLHGMFKTSGTSCKSWPASETTLQSAAPTSEDCFILLEKECIMDTAPLHF